MRSQTAPDDNRRKAGTLSFSNDPGFYASGTLGRSSQDYIHQGLMPLAGSNQGSEKIDNFPLEESVDNLIVYEPPSKLDVTTRRRSPNSNNLENDNGLSNEQNTRSYYYSDKIHEKTPSSKRFRRTLKLKSFISKKSHRTSRITSLIESAPKHINILFFAAVLVWYFLGILSISTTKIILRDFDSFGVTPLTLTIQQFLIGLFFLRLWIYYGGNGPQPMDYKFIFRFLFRTADDESLANMKLFYAASFFAFGFLLTNVSFGDANPSFIETIKASEPITSALLAVLWGIEQLSVKEASSLLGITVGVIISTLGNASTKSNVDDDYTNSLMESFYICGVVVIGNICFSFRSLYQKIFRESSFSKENKLDDLNLQYRFHQIGLMVLLLTFVVYEMPSTPRKTGISSWSGFWSFCGLSVINAVAFTHYNLASSYILSRISVIRHAALNCLRRLFAIVVTSILFSVPITAFARIGIAISLIGFLLFTKFKVQRKAKTRSHTSLLPISNAKP